MDKEVPRINAERRAISRRPYRPYRPRKPYLPRQPTQLELIQQHVSRMIKEKAEQQQKEAAERKKKAEVAAEEVVKPPAKKTRRKYKVTFIQPTTDKEGNEVERKGEMVTARDLVSMMPSDKAVFVVCNPEKSICKIKPKEEVPKKEVDTIAKPRYSNPDNTLILTTKYNEDNDVDEILEEFQA